ncbi:MAG: transketolase [Verrucomicrobia bacterium]|nr:transketolase [Verrucomicrobiota bacterium]
MALDSGNFLSRFARSIRSLSIDMVENAKSGHPGAPLGLADVVSYLFKDFLNYSPEDPHWLGRDRFVLSAGHASAMLYSTLFLTGYKFTMDDLKKFRQLNSKTPGHPEVDLDYGIECTTGPLGQGIGNAVGMALAQKIMQARFGNLFEAKTVVVAGDGCFMEGVAQEALSLAGHLGLNNLIVIYDYNSVTLDGFREDSASEDVATRYAAESYDVFVVDGHNYEDIHRVLSPLREHQQRPVLILAKTIIGYGAKKKAGTHEAHGEPLGAEELQNVKEFHNIPLDKSFWFDEEIKQQFSSKNRENLTKSKNWSNHPKAAEAMAFIKEPLSKGLEEEIKKIAWPDSISGRDALKMTLPVIAKHQKNFFTMSADLSGSDRTAIKDGGVIRTGSFEGRVIRAGIREHGMAAIANGMRLFGLRILTGTFFCFSDYMRPSLRLAALSHVNTIFVFTHDSVGLGEDGPTHQPIEHLASLRAMPNLLLFRPSDPFEVAMGLYFAMGQHVPVAMVLSRQAYARTPDLKSLIVENGHAVVFDHKGAEASYDYCIFATGSEVALAVDVAKQLQQKGRSVRVVSLFNFKLYDAWLKNQAERVPKAKSTVSIEMAASFGWCKYAKIHFSIDTFGASAPIKDNLKFFGFTPDAIVSHLSMHTSS